jgi:hypothetical protein
MSDAAFQFTDRYQAAGIPYPQPGTVCLGQCEGMGCVPINRDETEPRFKALWEEAHRTKHSITDRMLIQARELAPWFPFHREGCDGWHFVRCPDCNGTGKRPDGSHVL